MTDRELLESKELLRPDEVARILRVSKRHVYQLAEDGFLERVSLPSRIVRVRTDSVRALLYRGEE